MNKRFLWNLLCYYISEKSKQASIICDSL